MSEKTGVVCVAILFFLLFLWVVLSSPEKTHKVNHTLACVEGNYIYIYSDKYGVTSENLNKICTITEK